MNEEKFNTELRRFLKKVGITAQQEIERSVADAIERGQISGDETLNATATIRIGEIELETTIDSSIRLE